MRNTIKSRVLLDSDGKTFNLRLLIAIIVTLIEWIDLEWKDAFQS